MMPRSHWHRQAMNMPMAVDKSKLDKKLFTLYFKEDKVHEVPSYANQYVIFRRGIGIDKTTDDFIMPKVDLLLERSWNWIRGKLGLHKEKNQEVVHVHSLSTKRSQIQESSGDGVQKEEKGSGSNGTELRFERIRILNMDISFKNLFIQNAVQEPTFDRMIVVYRLLELVGSTESRKGDAMVLIAALILETDIRKDVRASRYRKGSITLRKR